LAVTVLGLYRFAVTGLPWFWLLMDRAGWMVSRACGVIVRQPLQTGATYAGLDFLVLVAALSGPWLARLPRPRGRWMLRVALMVGAAHFVYLALLALAPRILGWLPAKGPEPQFGMKAPWDFAFALRSLLPWNLPVVAAL